MRAALPPQLLLLLVLSGLCQTLNWQENLRPKLFFSMRPRDYSAFRGEARNGSSSFNLLFVPDFKAKSGGGGYGGGTRNTQPPTNSLNSPKAGSESASDRLPEAEDDAVLLIGAENVVYKLTASELRLTQTLRWHTTDSDRDSCLVKGKKRSACQNYISIIQQFSDDPHRYLVCGTNAFKPMCREYADERGGYVEKSERKGLGLAPFDPGHNSTAVLVGEDLYAGTVADFTGVDPIIFRKPLRTQQYDSVQLNSPDFVGSFEHKVRRARRNKREKG